MSVSLPPLLCSELELQIIPHLRSSPCDAEALEKMLPENSDLRPNTPAFDIALNYYNEGNPLYFTRDGTWYMPMKARLNHYSYIAYYLSPYVKDPKKIWGTITIAAYESKDSHSPGHVFFAVTPHEENAIPRTLHVTSKEKVTHDRWEAFRRGELIVPIAYREKEVPNIIPDIFAIYGATQNAINVELVDMTLAKLVNSDPRGYDAKMLGLDLPSLLQCNMRSNDAGFWEHFSTRSPIIEQGDCVTATLGFVKGVLQTTGFGAYAATANALVENMLRLFYPPTRIYSEQQQEYEIDLRALYPTLVNLPNTKEEDFKATFRTRRIDTHPQEVTLVDTREISKKLHHFMDREDVHFTPEPPFSAATILKILDEKHIDYITPRQISSQQGYRLP